jgi:hypothetical protein
MNYFAAISARCAELNEAGQRYLDQFDFIPNDEILQRIWDKAWEIDAQPGENPEWVDMTCDNCIPFGSVPNNGSIYYSLGWAETANDACLRNLLEIAEGRTTEELDLATLAEKEIVESYCSQN